MTKRSAPFDIFPASHSVRDGEVNSEARTPQRDSEVPRAGCEIGYDTLDFSLSITHMLQNPNAMIQSVYVHLDPIRYRIR